MGSRFPSSCERIVIGVKESNMSRPKNKQVNPFAIALSNAECRKDFQKLRKKKQGRRKK